MASTVIPGQLADEVVSDTGCRVDEVLTVVEHEQRLPGLEVAVHSLFEIFWTVAGADGDPEARREGRQDQGLVRHLSELEHPDPVRIALGHPTGEMHR